MTTRGGGVIVGVVVALAGRSAQGQVPTECVGDEAVPYECFVDATCPLASNYEQVRRSVVHIYGPDSVGSGVLINNADCSGTPADSDCGKPYLLTSAHIVYDFYDPHVTANDIYSIENEFSFTLGYAASSCGSEFDTYSISVGGCSVAWHSDEKDLLLLHLDTSLPLEAAPYYAGWGGISLDDSSLAMIGHPCGGPQKIALADPIDFEFQQIVGVDLLHIWGWDVGAQQSGSSGGPLLTPDGKVSGIFKRQALDLCEMADASFVALTSIVPFLGPVAADNWDFPSFDPSSHQPIEDVATVDAYFGNGDTVKINAHQEVRLMDPFHADIGSFVRVVIVPEGPG